MLWKLLFLVFAAVTVGAFTLAGCNQAPAPPKAADSEKAAQPAAAASETSSGLAELSEADRKAAEKQKICPVSGEKLGTMGKPFKVSAKGRDIFLCCDGCKADFDKDPDKYFKKLDEQTK